MVMSLLLTAIVWYSNVPKITWMRLMPVASYMGEVSSSSGFWMLAPYMISQCFGVTAVVCVALDGHI